MLGKAIQPLNKPIKYALSVPGSKSFVNRALICAALQSRKTTIQNPNYCEDVVYFIAALEKIGVKIVRQPQTITVHGVGGKFSRPQRALYLGNAGTATRFLLPLVPAGTIITGNRAMQRRPIQPLITALRQLGYTIESATGCPPVKVVDNTITNHHITIDGSLSSQYVSALLFLQSQQTTPLHIRVTGKPSSRPYIAMTKSVINHFKTHSTYSVPADASSATYWWALAAITGSHITVNDIDAQSSQADIQFLRVLQRMGCTIKGNTVVGPQQLRPITVNMRNFPDAVMSAAIVAACAPGKTVITNIEHLRVKETDRLRVLVRNLRAVGIWAVAKQSQLMIYGNPRRVHGGIIRTYNDHRFAMAFAILGLRYPGIHVDHPACVKKSYPSFWNDLRLIQRHSRQQTIMLTGMRGSGKSTLAKKLAQTYKAKYIDFDAEIAKHVGMPIHKYVQHFGWKKFRAAEYDIVKKFFNVSNAIIATGGGTLMFPRNRDRLTHYYTLLLYAPIAVLRKRLAQDESIRPALHSSTLSELGAIWKERREKYYKVADVIYDSRHLN